MLDMAFGLEDTYVRTSRLDSCVSFAKIPYSSRLGCQVKITRDLDGMSVQLPSATRNFAVDGPYTLSVSSSKAD
jgi:hypothetical protein